MTQQTKNIRNSVLAVWWMILSAMFAVATPNPQFQIPAILITGAFASTRYYMIKDDPK